MIKVITGNEAAAYGAMLSQPDVVCAYPITPQSRIPEQISEFYAQGLLRGKFINVESEMGALSCVIGASAGGVRTFTATSSQGLAWMHEGLHWAAGSRLPIVMAVVNRPLGAPQNLTCGQDDSLSQRDTGWMQFYCESNQEVLDTIIQAYRISESVGLPSMVCLDGVYLSFLSESVDIPDQEKVGEYLPPYRPTYEIPPRTYKLFLKGPPDPYSYIYDGDRFIGFENYFMDRYELHKLQSKCLENVIQANDEFQALFGRGYPPVEEYRCDDSDLVVVMSGSAAGTGRYVIDKLREKGQKVGLVKFKMFRPFPRELIRKILCGREKIVVIERDISSGQCGIFYQEIEWALSNVKHKSYGFVSGLGGNDITPSLIEKAIRFATQNEPRDQALWLGLPKKEVGDDYDRNTVTIY